MSTTPPTFSSLAVRGLTKTFFDVPAIEDVEFEVVSGEIHGLLGENGAGKSTLCSVLAGLYRPDVGEITIDGQPVHLRSPHDAAANGIGMVYQHFRLVDTFTVAENIVLGMGRSLGRSALRQVEQEVGALVDEFGLDIHPSAAVWQLSVGEQQRVEIVKQLYRGARFLILDEPTAVLAPHEADRLFEVVRHMADTGHGVVLVSHKMQEILGHTDRVTVLRGGRNAGHGPTAEFGRDDLNAMVFGDRQVGRVRPSLSTIEPGEAVLAVSDLVVPGDRGLVAVDGVSFQVRRGEIVGVAGVAGNGQRELHEAISGLRATTSGTVIVGSTDCSDAAPRVRTSAGLAYVPEDRLGTGLAPGLPLDDNLVLRSFGGPPHSRWGVLVRSEIRATATRLEAEFDVRGNRPGLPVSSMSGGNLQKAILARELTAPHEVLVAAALTRGLDLAAAEAVRDLVCRERDANRGVLLFSEDLSEVLDLADVVLVMFRGRIVGSFPRDEVDLGRVGLLMTGAACRVSVLPANPFVVTPRASAPMRVRLGVPLVALLVALGLGALVLLAFGNSPIEAFKTMSRSSVQGWRPFSRTLTYATPLILTGLAAAVAFRMKVYNIGAEGQLFVGAIAASGLALALGDSLPKPLMLIVVILGGALAGALWAQLAAIPKALFGTDEIITTLMLNFVALGLMNYLIQGSRSFWRNPTHPVPQGKEIPASAQLPVVYERLHLGFFVAVGVAIVLWLVLRVTPWGFRLKVIGDSRRAARYAGIGVGAMTIAVMAISGGIAGVAGAIEVSAVTKGLDPKALAIELGYTGIIIAAVARLNAFGVVPVAVFLAAITVSGSSLQSIGVASELVVLLQGLIFLSVTAGEFFVTNRVRLASRHRGAVDASSGASTSRSSNERTDTVELAT